MVIFGPAMVFSLIDYPYMTHYGHFDSCEYM